MRDCTNTAVRDLLPDLLHDRLPASVRADVRAHVDGCADCRAELELLGRVYAARATPRIDTARIAAALPPYRAGPRWSRWTAVPQLRAAAAIVLLAGAAAILMLLMRAPGARDRMADLPRADSPAVVVGRGTAPRVTPAPPTKSGAPAITPGARTRTPTELAVGETLSDLDERELRMLLEALDGLDAVTLEEDDVIVPALSATGRGADGRDGA